MLSNYSSFYRIDPFKGPPLGTALGVDGMFYFFPVVFQAHLIKIFFGDSIPGKVKCATQFKALHCGQTIEENVCTKFRGSGNRLEVKIRG